MFDAKLYRQEHRDKQRTYHKQWREANAEKLKTYRRGPRFKYSIHKSNAKQRGVEWNLIYEQWWSIWAASGKWEQRGPHGEQYCMCRNGDTGPYSIDNVRIDTTVQNIKERHGTR